MTNNKNVIVTLACNDAYVNYAMVLIYSIYANRNPNRTYEIKLFGNEITNENKIRIENLTSPKFEVTVYDVTQELQERASSENLDSHISIDTYTRFFIIDQLTDYEKIIYIDIDTILCTDIAILFDIDLKDKTIGATADMEVHKHYNDMTTKIHLIPKITIHDYLNDILKLTSPYNYFQAGVLLIDIKKMNEKLPLEKALGLISKKFNLADQDILNHVLNEDVQIIDEKWNLVVRSAIKHPEYAKRNKGHINILHYTGPRKPWRKPKIKFGDIWWDYACKLHKINPLHNLKFPYRHTTLRIPYRLIKTIYKIFSK